MSRSYKKHPYSGRNCKDMKRFANQKVRHLEDIPNGKAYRKMFPTWDICEYGSILTLEEYIHRYRNPLRRWWYRKEKSDQELTREWYTMYKMKQYTTARQSLNGGTPAGLVHR